MIIDDALTGEVPQPGTADRTRHRRPAGKEGARPDAAVDGHAADGGTADGTAGSRSAQAGEALPRSLGLAPGAADRTIRIAQARFLLESGATLDNPDRQRTGFCDASHLINVFREREGITPEAYRLRARAAAPRASTKLSRTLQKLYDPSFVAVPRGALDTER